MNQRKIVTEIYPGTATGRWAFSTLSGSRYVIDFASRTVSRLPGIPNTPGGTVNLRRDGEAVLLLREPKITIGEPCRLLIHLGVEGVPVTVRTTTQVVYIEKLVEEAVA